MLEPQYHCVAKTFDVWCTWSEVLKLEEMGFRFVSICRVDA